MYSKIVDNKFDSLVNQKRGLSSLATEKLLKDLGIIISRKTFPSLCERNIIDGPILVNNSETENGKRIFYSLESVKQLLSYCLAVEATGIKGRVSENKADYFQYANEALNEVGNTENIVQIAHLKSITIASYFVKTYVSSKKRLEAVKEVQHMLEKIFLSYWLTKRWMSVGSDFDIVEAWSKVRVGLFNVTTLKRFASLVRNNITMENNMDSSITEIERMVRTVKKNGDATRALIAWLEILMVYTTGTSTIVAELEAYMHGRYGMKIDLTKDTVASVIMLYKFLK